MSVLYIRVAYPLVTNLTGAGILVLVNVASFTRAGLLIAVLMIAIIFIISETAL